ncbi:hypothetical protein DA2_3644 [Desulfovibrio sp. A2]|nr:hypothetical protein DA2_3644 [Desulfovibrio sp. A2]
MASHGWPKQLAAREMATNKPPTVRKTSDGLRRHGMAPSNRRSVPSRRADYRHVQFTAYR